MLAWDASANAALPGGLDFLKGAGIALSLFSVPRARGEAERREALVRNAAPVTRLAVGPIPGSPGITGQ